MMAFRGQLHKMKDQLSSIEKESKSQRESSNKLSEKIQSDIASAKQQVEKKEGREGLL